MLSKWQFFVFPHYRHLEECFEGDLCRENLDMVFLPFKEEMVRNSLKILQNEQDFKGVKMKLLKVQVIGFL